MKILVVVYYWPPSAGSGVQRWLKMTKYMQGEKCDVHVYTPENPDYNIKDATLLKDIHPDLTVVKRKIWEPYKLARLFTGKTVDNTGTDQAKKSRGVLSNLIQIARARLFIPDPRKFWVRPSVRFLKKYIQEKNIDAIITSGPPHSLHNIGYRLARKLDGLKWIMDVRDPISKLDFMADMGVKGELKIKYEAYEKKMLAGAHAVVGTSYSLPEFLMPFNTDKFHTIPNGYDEADFKREDNHSGGEILLSHAGVFNRYRFSANFWKALKLLDESLDFKVKLAGPISTDMLTRARELSGLGERIENLGYISHEEVLNLYRQSSLILLLSNKSAMGKTTIPGKIFELMASRKPVLGLGESGSDAAMVLEKSGSGKMMEYDESVEKIHSYLLNILRDKKIDRNEKYIKKFSRRELAADYLAICRHLL